LQLDCSEHDLQEIEYQTVIPQTKKLP